MGKLYTKWNLLHTPCIDGTGSKCSNESHKLVANESGSQATNLLCYMKKKKKEQKFTIKFKLGQRIKEKPNKIMQ